LLFPIKRLACIFRIHESSIVQKGEKGERAERKPGNCRVTTGLDTVNAPPHCGPAGPPLPPPDLQLRLVGALHAMQEPAKRRVLAYTLRLVYRQIPASRIRQQTMVAGLTVQQEES
jgi:hypothetical protein